MVLRQLCLYFQHLNPVHIAQGIVPVLLLVALFALFYQGIGEQQGVGKLVGKKLLFRNVCKRTRTGLFGKKRADWILGAQHIMPQLVSDGKAFGVFTQVFVDNDTTRNLHLRTCAVAYAPPPLPHLHLGDGGSPVGGPIFPRGKSPRRCWHG